MICNDCESEKRCAACGKQLCSPLNDPHSGCAMSGHYRSVDKDTDELKIHCMVCNDILKR